MILAISRGARIAASQSPPEARSRRPVPYVAVLLSALIFFSAATVTAEEPIGGDTPHTTPAAQQPDENRLARQRIEAAFYVLLGIVLVGVVLLGLVLVWGHQLRRRLRKSTATTTRWDEFWYLRQNERRQQLERRDTAQNLDSDTDQTFMGSP